MKEKNNTSENGQVLVLLVLVIVGLLAFTALAVDGGMVFADRRGAQNAADAAVLAGGYRIANTLEDFNLGYNITYMNWSCTNVEAVIGIARPEAIVQASTNSYPITGDSSLTMVCQPGVDFGSYIDRYADTTAQIISDVETSFVHFAFGGAIKNTVTAVARVRPRMPLAFGYAIYAHREDCPNSNTGGVRFDGNNNVTIDGGGVMSDACMDANGSVHVQVNGGEINYITSYAPSGNPYVNPAPALQPNLLPDWALLFPEPDCSSLSAGTTNGNGTISPGIYTDITVNGSDSLTMSPGLYCLDGDFSVTGNTTVIGEGVTIFMRDGDFTTNGGGVVRLSAPNYVVEDNDGVTGMLIYIASENPGSVDLTGNSQSYYSGTIFGEHEDSRIEIGGTGDMTTGCYNGIPCFGTQLIAGTVKVHGNAIIDIDFVSNAVYYLPARLTLER
ncbi:MAG TPA: Tad domain-containing protein [Anaerolineales bacterium]|nr:Tad domain-containing protein [Anaerolineales bacterium]